MRIHQSVGNEVRNYSSSLDTFSLVYVNPQMPPRRAPDNNNTEMQQMVAAQNQFFQMMTQFMANNSQSNNNPPPIDMLTRFMRLRPATFSRASEPMMANDWLQSVKKVLVTIGCTDAEKVRFAAYLLEGPAASWWDNFQITHPIEEVTWEIFEDGFRTAHISSGVMSLKKKEFHNLRQGIHSVAEYIDEFSNLARYAPDDVNTDAKRKEKFLDGLNDELSIQLSVAYIPTYQSLCDKAIILESKMKQVGIKKRKHSFGKYHFEPS